MHPIVELVFLQLTEARQGRGERFTMTPAAVDTIERALRASDDLAGGAPAVAQVAWMLDAQLASPTAARQLLAVLERVRPLLEKVLARLVAARAVEGAARGRRASAQQGQRIAARAPHAFAPAPAGTISVRALAQARAVGGRCNRL